MKAIKDWYWVTHPEKPVYNGKARGRVLHLRNPLNKRLSLCNMKIVEKYTDGNIDRKKCKVCLSKKNNL